MLTKIPVKVLKRWEERLGKKKLRQIVLDIVELEYPFLKFEKDGIRIILEEEESEVFLLFDEFLSKLNEILIRRVGEKDAELMIREVIYVDPTVYSSTEDIRKKKTKKTEKAIKTNKAKITPKDIIAISDLSRGAPLYEGVDLRLSEIWNPIEDTHESIEAYQKAYESDKATGNKQGMAKNLTMIGNLLLKQSKEVESAENRRELIEESIKIFMEAISLFKEIGDKKSEAMVRRNLAVAYELVYDSEKAEEERWMSAQIRKEIRDTTLEAEELVDEAIALIRESEKPEKRLEALWKLADAYDIYESLEMVEERERVKRLLIEALSFLEEEGEIEVAAEIFEMLGIEASEIEAVARGARVAGMES